MTQTITALFDNRADAARAVSELVAAGIPAANIHTTPETDVSSAAGTRTAYDVNRDDQGFWASMKDIFMPEEDRYAYTEAMHRGSIMVAASVEDAYASRAEDILEKHGTVELDEREKAWRKEGWTGMPAAASASTSGSARSVTGTAATATDTAKLGTTGKNLGNEKLEIVEERLSVGKRQVNSGRVKIRSYVVETPVSEKVNLRSETVKVDRVAVDRALAPGEDAFKERTIEATATSEEAIVDKQARVTGEVRVSKTADERVETIQDKVRTTKVEVDDGRVVEGGGRVVEGAPIPPKR